MLRPTVVVLFAVQLLGSPGATEAARKGSAQELAEADLAFHGERYKRAMKAYERAAESPETRFPALLGVARSHLALENWDEAAGFARQAQEAAPSAEERSVALNLQGLVFTTASRRPGPLFEPGGGEQRSRFRKQAIDAFRAALEAFGEAPAQVWMHLADAQIRDGQLLDARATLETLLERAPESEASIAGLVSHLECIEGVSGAKNAAWTWDDDVVPPKPVLRKAPPIPPGSPPLAGTAHFDSVIDKDGGVHCVRLIEHRGLTPEFLSGAAEALGQWTFEPAVLHGRPVAVGYIMTISVDARP